MSKSSSPKELFNQLMPEKVIKRYEELVKLAPKAAQDTWAARRAVFKKAFDRYERLRNKSEDPTEVTMEELEDFCEYYISHVGHIAAGMTYSMYERPTYQKSRDKLIEITKRNPKYVKNSHLIELGTENGRNNSA